MILAQRRALEQMKKQGIVPTHQVLDNEIYTTYRQDIKHMSMTFQLILRDEHRHNLAENAIQTWKDHFIELMSGVTAAFHAHLWCQSIPQAERK